MCACATANPYSGKVEIQQMATIFDSPEKQLAKHSYELLQHGVFTFQLVLVNVSTELAPLQVIALKRHPHYQIISPAHSFHCAMHCMNLCVTKTIYLPIVRHAQIFVKDGSPCFRSTANRTELLITHIKNADDTSVSKNKLNT